MKKNALPQKSVASADPNAAGLAKETLRLIESGRMGVAEIVDCAELLKQRGDIEGSAAAYKLWLRGNKTPNRHVAWFNLGVTLSMLGRSEEALEAYEQAIFVHANFPEALLNLGLLLERSGEPKKALEKWRILADLNTTTDHKCAGLNQIGRLCEILEIFDQAEEALALSLQLRPKQTDALQHWLRVRQKRCIWPIYGDLPGHTKCDMLLATSPIAMLGESDSPLNQLYAARALGIKLYPNPEPPLSEGRKYNHRRLRVGYLSSDFNIHAVGLLLAEVFESHDLAKFETYGFCVSKEDRTEHRQRLIAAFEHFEKVGHLSDEQIARRILEQEIDLLIDLNGVSSNTRVGVLRYRPAPVQATWLGYIGTTALPWIDYVITDKIALPEKLSEFFTEKPLYLKHSFLPFDSHREVVPASARETHGLPEGAFVFASFNNVTKLNPKMFSTWLRILKRVPNSVLWLVDDNPWATANLKQFALQHGIGAERLVFSERCPYGIHLARVPHTDLFLDNHPYNAGSTGNDTLHMGVPMLTLAGETFVSRMGYSLLHDFGLTELVTFNHQEYEDRAVELATNRGELAEIRRRLLQSKTRKSRESCVEYTRDLERLFLEATGHTPPSEIHSVVVRSVRNTPHPLSICSEFQLLALSEKTELQLFVDPLQTPERLKVPPTELPAFPKVAARILSLIPKYAGEKPEVVLNLVSPPAPYEGHAGLVVHFISSDAFSSQAEKESPAMSPSGFTEGNQLVVTPSAWSRDELVHLGMRPERVLVVPFGVDGNVFQPLLPAGRLQVRTQMGLAPDDFVLLHVGGMSAANGGDLLLRAFAELRRENSKLRLILRENSFEPGGGVQQANDALRQTEPDVITPDTIAGLILLPNAVSLNYAQFFYGVSDLYVAPFRSEAFHLPVLEAVACGLRVLVTEGGGVDSCLTPGVCAPIKAKLSKRSEQGGSILDPDYNQFLRQLRQALKQPAQGILEADRKKFVEKWCWTNVADRLSKIVRTAAEAQEH